MTELITIERHILEHQERFPDASGKFTNLLYDIALAAKIISRETNRAGLADIIGATEGENVYGERQQKLDMFADHVLTFCQRTQASGSFFISSLIFAVFSSLIVDLAGFEQDNIKSVSYFCLLIGFLLIAVYWVQYVFWYRFMIYLKTLVARVSDKNGN